MLKRKEKAQELVKLGNIDLKDGAYQKAKGSFVEAKSIYESQPGYSREVAEINRKLGAVNAAINKAKKAQEAATRRKSGTPVTRRNSSVASAGRKDSSTASTVRMSSNFSSINTVLERMSKPSTSRLSAHDGSVNDEVFVDKASFFKQDERARASDACQESRRRSDFGSASDNLVMRNVFTGLGESKKALIGCDLSDFDFIGVIQREIKKSASAPELERSNTFTKRSTSTGLNTSVSTPELERSNTFTKRSPNSEEDEITNDADPFLQFDSYATDISDFNNPSTNKDRSISGSSQSSLRNDGLGNPSTNMGQLMLECVAFYRGKEGGKT